MTDTTAAEKIVVTCMNCPKQAKVNPTLEGEPKTPINWKKRPEGFLCKKCFQSSFRTFAVTIPVTGPDNMSWKDLSEAMRESFAESTAYKNWLITEFFNRDIRRDKSMERMPSWKKPYLYPESAHFRIHPAMRAFIENQVGKIYGATRYEILWSGRRSLASFRYPQPWSVNDARLVGLPARDKYPPCFGVEVRFLGAKERTVLRLSASQKQHYRQLAVIKELINGNASYSEVTIYSVPARESDHRQGISEGNKPSRPKRRIMCKIVVTAPRQTTSRVLKDRFFNISTTEESLIHGVLQDREDPWVINADHVKDWCYQYLRRQQRQSCDLKHEVRIPKARKKRFTRDAAEWALKHNNRLKTFINQACCQIVSFAQRNDVTRISYDDTVKTYVPRFPWFQLEMELARHCKDAGIDYVYHGTKEKEEEDEYAEGEEA